MRIVFLCSGLEPGADGVGDYTRRLAGQFIRQGHTATAIALFDGAISDARDCEQNADGTGVTVLRLPRQIPWPERAARARAWTEAFAPDWVSLQFVCFGLHPRGLVHRAIPPLRALCPPHRTHWMFHELWVGMDRKASWLFKAWGLAQQFLILRLHRRLRPPITHTSNEQYARVLGCHGITAAVLPLFGNVPVCPPSGWLKSELDRLEIRDHERASWVLLGIFGAIHAEWTTDGWLDHLLSRAAATGRRIAVLGIGRLDPAGKARFDALAGAGKGRLLLHHFGEQPGAHVSEFLQGIDAGISTIQRSLLGKSGSVAAMREHATPVLVTRVDEDADPDQARAHLRREIDRLMLVRGGVGRRPVGESALATTAKILVSAFEQADGRTRD